MSDQTFCVIFVAFLAAVTCSALPSVGRPATGTANLVITPAKTQIKPVGSRLIFTCALAAAPSTDDNTIHEELPLEEGHDMRWKGPDSNYITDDKGRVYTERIDDHRLRLYITEVEEGDSGSYSCEKNANGDLIVAHGHLRLFEDIRFLDGFQPLIHQPVGSTAFLECSAEGKPEPEISWRFRGKKLISDANPKKYSYERNGLRIRNITKEDNGTYECRAQVASQGNLKVRPITLDVQYPPEWVAPIKLPVAAIRGSDVTLECRADGNPPVTYKWYKESLTSYDSGKEPLLENELEQIDGELDSTEGDTGADGALYTIKAVDLADKGLYVCTASNALGTAKALHEVRVLVPPMVTTAAQPPVLEGRTAVLLCEAAGIPPPSISWIKKGDDEGPEVIDVMNDVGDVVVNTTSDGISRLIIRNAVRARHSGKYLCIGNNSAGVDSKEVNVVIETLPVARISDMESVGWRGERRQVTCFARGLPLPTIVWLHDGRYVSTNRTSEMTSSLDAENVTSSLEIKLDDESEDLFGNYSCVAKNVHGYDSKVFHLRRAFPPESPRNITVTSKTHNSITLSVAAAAAAAAAASAAPEAAALPPTRWIVKYQKTSDAAKEETTINLLYEEGSNIVVENLDAGTVYTMYLSAANAAGVGPSVKFQAETFPAPESNDLPIKYPGQDDESGEFQGDDSRSLEESLKRQAVAREDIILDRGPLTDWGGLSIGLVIGIAVMLAVVIVTVSGALVRTQRVMRARRAVVTVIKTKGKPESGGATTETIKVSECKDIDNLKVETSRPKTSVGPIPGDRYGSLGSRKNFLVTANATGSVTTISNSASPVMARSVAAGASPNLGASRGGAAKTEAANSTAQSQAWQNMLLKAEAEARDEALLQQLEAETMTEELPHPPLEMLLHPEKPLQKAAGDEGDDDDGVENPEDYDEDEDGPSKVKDSELSDDGMSLASDEEVFQKPPQFEGKSFLQY